ncbi:MAG: hypothetical protein V7L00_32525 [Nostoc sp.]
MRIALSIYRLHYLSIPQLFIDNLLRISRSRLHLDDYVILLLWLIRGKLTSSLLELVLNTQPSQVKAYFLYSLITQQQR